MSDEDANGVRKTSAPNANADSIANPSRQAR
jgi:hypothetical protein